MVIQTGVRVVCPIVVTAISFGRRFPLKSIKLASLSLVVTCCLFTGCGSEGNVVIEGDQYEQTEQEKANAKRAIEARKQQQ